MTTKSKKMLAIDMGATSVRGILAWQEDGHLKTREIDRFSHEPVQNGDGLFWDFQGILHKITDMILRCGEEIGSIGVDCWGVDFGLLDTEGNLILPPHAYRDPANHAAHEAFRAKLSDEEAFEETGIHVMDINSVYQLYRLKMEEGDSYGRIHHVLMLSDLICYYLTGEMHTDLSALSTSQLYHTGTHSFSRKILDTMELPESAFPPLATYGSFRGSTRNARITSLRQYSIPVCSVAGHDTADAALVTAAMNDPDTLFLSCGTWSLLGAVRDQAIITPDAYKADFTNELTVGGHSLFLKNITGLYVMEKFKKQMEKRTGQDVCYHEITEKAARFDNCDFIFDIDDPVFMQDDFDAKAAITLALRYLGKSVPEDDFGYFASIYQSLAEKYRTTAEALARVTGRTYRRMQVIGGGAKSDLLCQLIADRLNIPVLAGPQEATALGNLALQMTASGQFTDVMKAAAFAADSEQQKLYFPKKEG